MNKLTIGIVSPCYNEELVLNETSLQLNSVIEELVLRNIISERSFIAFIDDGSNDNTWKIY